MTAAELNAQFASGNGKIPPGEHWLDGPLMLRSGLVIEGPATLKMIAPGPAITKAENDYLYRFGLKNIVIDYSDCPPDERNVGIDLHGPGGGWMFHIEDVDVINAEWAYSATFEVFLGSIKRVLSRNCRNGFCHITGTTMAFENCFAGGGSGRGWHLEQIQGCTLTACAMDGYTSNAPFFAADNGGLTINGFDAEINRPPNGPVFRFRGGHSTWNGAAFPGNVPSAEFIHYEGGTHSLSGMGLPGPLRVSADARVSVQGCAVPGVIHDGGSTAATFAAVNGVGAFEVWEANPNLRLRFPDGRAALRLHSRDGQITVIDGMLPIAYRSIEGNDVLWASSDRAMIPSLRGPGTRPVFVDKDGFLKRA